MKNIVKGNDWHRSYAYNKFVNAPQPMCNLSARVNITRLMKHKKNHKLNTMLLYCIQEATEECNSFHFDFHGVDEVVRYDHVATDLIIYGTDDELHFVQIPYVEGFKEFEAKYLELTSYCKEHNCDNIVENHAHVSTSTVASFVFDAIIPGYRPEFHNPFFMWSRYQKSMFKTVLGMTFSCHHTFFDGRDIGEIFNKLQEKINSFDPKKS